MKKVALVGNPNSGKTSLFNVLTGCQECVGNWVGATSSCCQALSCSSSTTGQYRLLDTPGCYDLLTSHQQQVTEDSHTGLAALIRDKDMDLLVNVVDVDQLARQLYLTTQLLETAVPMIVVLSRMDSHPERHQQIDENKLSERLGCPVVKLSARTGWGIRRLKQVIQQQLSASSDFRKKQKPAALTVTYPPYLTETIIQEQQRTQRPIVDVLFHLIQDYHAGSSPSFALSAPFRQMMLDHKAQDLSDLVALSRHRWLEGVLSRIVVKNRASARQSYQVDRLFMHAWYGLPLFLCALLMTFWLSIGMGQWFQDILMPWSTLLCVDFPARTLRLMGAPSGLLIVMREGLGFGLVTSLGFFPLMTSVFFALTLLQESGLLTRCALVLDRFLNRLGLPGESLVALIVGFGCNVPGIASVDQCKDKQDRLVTIMMMPFMTCSARLAIFSAFCASFFGSLSPLVMIFLYTLGVAMALMTGLLLRHTGHVTAHKPQAMLELPSYQMPDFIEILTLSWQKSWQFVRQAAVYIIPVCVILSILMHVDTAGNFHEDTYGADSVLALVSQFFMFLSPVPLNSEAWPLVLALVMGLIAKEVVIGVLSFFYAGWIGGDMLAQTLSWQELLFQAVAATRDTLTQMPAYFLPGWHEQMVLPGLAKVLPSTALVLGYLVFVLLYFPCVGTLVAMAKRVGRDYTLYSVLWSFGMAYLGAFIVVKAAQSWLWAGVIILAITAAIIAYRRMNILSWRLWLKGPKWLYYSLSDNQSL